MSRPGPGTMRLLRPLVLGLLGLVLTGHPAGAGASFRGRAGSDCTFFPITEFGLATRLAPKPQPADDSDFLLVWNIGGMGNTSQLSAIGATLKITADGDGHRLGPAFRYRRWLSRRTGLDLALGAYVDGKDNFAPLRFPSANVEMGVSVGDLVGFSVGLESLRYSGQPVSWQGYAGARCGSLPAPVVTVGLGLLVAAAMD